MTPLKFQLKGTLSEKTRHQIDAYITLLKTYNETTNIYSKLAYDKLDFHINDCINIAELCQNKKQTITDFGSGSGLPSIIISILCTESKVIAIESKSRKTKFLEWVKNELHLHNLEVVNQNIHEWIHHHSPKSDIITSKAFASIEKALPIAKKIATKNATYITPISLNQLAELKKIPGHTKTFTDKKLETAYLITTF